MTDLEALMLRQGVSIIYDGECPFCTAYVKMLRLREAVGAVNLLDARRSPALVKELAERGMVIDREMVAVYGGVLYAGGDAIHMLALITSPSGAVNRIFSGLMRDRERARALYPYLRGGRNLALRLLGRVPKI